VSDLRILYFKSELHRLLKVFSRDLSREASIPIEKKIIRFVSQQRRRISHAIGQEVIGLKKKLLFTPVVRQQQLDVNERIEQFLRDAAESRGGGEEEQSRARYEQNSDNDSSEDEGELGTFSNLEHVKKFLIESKAFEKLRISVRQLAVQQGESTSSRLDTASYQDPKDLEGSMTVIIDGHSEVSHNSLIKAEGKSGKFDKHIETEEIRGSSNFAQKAEEPTEPIGLYSKIEEDDNHSLGIGKMIYWGLSRHLRPKVKAGYRRLE
jgi:hypothetical protein